MASHGASGEPSIEGTRLGPASAMLTLPVGPPPPTSAVAPRRPGRKKFQHGRSRREALSPSWKLERKRPFVPSPKIASGAATRPDVHGSDHAPRCTSTNRPVRSASAGTLGYPCVRGRRMALTRPRTPGRLLPAEVDHPSRVPDGRSLCPAPSMRQAEPSCVGSMRYGSPNAFQLRELHGVSRLRV